MDIFKDFGSFEHKSLGLPVGFVGSWIEKVAGRLGLSQLANFMGWVRNFQEIGAGFIMQEIYTPQIFGKKSGSPWTGTHPKKEANLSSINFSNASDNSFWGRKHHWTIF